MKSTMKLMIAALVVVALLAVPAMARQVSVYNITAGDVVFVYETNLNVSTLSAGIGGAIVPPSSFRKYTNDQPDPSVAGGGSMLAQIPVNPDGTFSVLTAPPYLGVWFPYNASAGGYHVNPNNSIQIQHADVTLDAVLNASHSDSIAGKSVTRDTAIAFELTSTYAGNYYKYTTAGVTTYAALVNIELTTPGGGKIQIFGHTSDTVAGEQPADLRDITLIGSQEFTDSLSPAAALWIPSNAPAVTQYNTSIDLTGVEAGTYTATAKWVQTNPAIYNNVTNPWYNYEANSNAVTFTVLSKPITITTNKESVVRGNTFVVTITGESKKAYYVYLKDASIGATQDYPQIAAGQSNVNTTFNPLLAAVPDINPGAFATVPAQYLGENVTAAVVTTAADGTRAIEFGTTSQTDDTKYTVKVLDPVDNSKYDTVDISVEKGQVTVTYEGTGTYYLGEVIDLSGTNTDSQETYLYVVGPNLPENGVSLADITVTSVDGNINTFKQVDVNTDNTWTYKWDTSALTATLDAGTYTIYAAAEPQVKNNLSNTQYATASVVLKKPFVTASTSANTLAQGDILYIQGTAEGKPNDVFIWIFGKNYRDCQESATVQSDATYSYKLDRGDTTNLYAGQYFAVVQHPMENGVPDVLGVPTGPTCVWANYTASIRATNPGVPGVRLAGLQASDAANALVSALNSPNIDDTYTKLSFMVEAPWIQISTIGDHYVGDTFTISGTTNLAVGDQIQMTVVSSSFQPTEKTQTGEFSGTSGTVTVQQGTTYNTFSFDVDASTFKPDEYLVTAESIEPSQTVTSTFNVLEGQPTTAATTAPVTAVTTAAPATPVTTAVATTVPVTTAQPQPGFGILVSLVGLGAVALLVLRRR